MSRWVTIPFFLIWLCVIAGGMSKLWRHAQTPGRSAVAPGMWPRRTILPAPCGKPTLVLLAHPRCPCTRATLNALARVMVRCGSDLRAYVLFYKPAHAADGWEKTDIYAQAARIPGVETLTDKDGIQARAFKASTSGQVLLYDAHGRLVFGGGITPSRGHEGDSTGQDTIVAAAAGQTPTVTSTPVFGCSLFEEGSR